MRTAERCILPRCEGFCCSSVVGHWKVGLQVILVAMESLGSDNEKESGRWKPP